MYHDRFLLSVGTQNVGFRTHFLFGKKSVVDNFQIAEKVRGFVEEILENEELELIHIEVVGSSKSPTVRILIDKDGGIVHEDCSKVSSKTGEVLDQKDFISSAYVLEVSSPGIERGLYSLLDFEKFAGQAAKIRTKTLVEGQRNFKGQIIGVENETIVFDDKTSGRVEFPLESVKKANLVIDFEQDLKKARKRR